jgi:hypothetical protein
MKKTLNFNRAVYFGLTVDVVCKLDHYSLVRFGDRVSLVETADLVFACSAGHVA